MLCCSKFHSCIIEIKETVVQLGFKQSFLLLGRVDDTVQQLLDIGSDYCNSDSNRKGKENAIKIGCNYTIINYQQNQLNVTKKRIHTTSLSSGHFLSFLLHYIQTMVVSLYVSVQ